MNVNANKLNDIFTSPRDHQPFKIKFSVGGGPSGHSAVAFEDRGIDGRRQVGFTGPSVEEVDDVRYNELWSGKSSVSPEAGTTPTSK